MHNYVYSHQLGDIKLTIISEGTIKGSAAQAFAGIEREKWKPFVETDSEDYMTFGLNLVHLSIKDQSILIDTGIGEPHPTRTRVEQTFPFNPSASLIPTMEELGILPNQITDVIFSHTHSDHVMGSTVERNGQRIPAFPNARYLLMQEEWSAISTRMQPGSPVHLHLTVLQEHNLLDPVEDGHEVAPGVRMIASPGESPGHTNIRMDSDGKIGFFLGDLFHHPIEVANLDWIWPGRDRTQMIASREALVCEALSTNALLITAHMSFPGMGKLRQGSEGLKWVSINPKL